MNERDTPATRDTAATVTWWPSWSRRRMASMARARAWSLGNRVDRARWAVLSARIVGVVSVEGFEGGDDGVEAVLDLAQVGHLPEPSVGFGFGDEPTVGLGLGSVHGQELRCGLKVGACQASIRVRALALWWPPAVAVGQAVGDAGQVVLDPLGVGGRRLGVMAGERPDDVGPALA